MRKTPSVAGLHVEEDGVALHGAVVTSDNELNEAIYGMTARDILMGEKKITAAQMPPVVRILPQTLARNTIR